MTKTWQGTEWTEKFGAETWVARTSFAPICVVRGSQSVIINHEWHEYARIKEYRRKNILNHTSILHPPSSILHHPSSILHPLSSVVNLSLPQLPPQCLQLFFNLRRAGAVDRRGSAAA
jgi:hypothetical protein